MTDGLSRGLEGVKAQVDSSMRDIAAGAAAVLGSFGAFGKGFISQGLSQAMQFEQTTIAMETMLGSAAEAKQTLADLTTFAAKTPFEMPGILQVAQGMITFGERGKDLMDTMNMLADASGGTPANFQILGLVLNQIRGVGKLLTQDFRQLSTRGILFLTDIAKHFKVTEAEASKMLSSGKISFEDTKAILKGLTEEGGRFYKMSVKQSQSLEGLTSTMKDAWNILKRELATSIIPMIKVFTGVIIKVLDVASNMTDEMKGLASAAMVGATAFGLLGASIFGAIAASRLLGFSLKKALIGSGIGIIILAIGAGVGALAKWFASSSMAADMFRRVVETLQGVWDRISAKAMGFFETLRTFVQSNQAEFQQMGFYAVEIFENIWDNAKNIFNNLKDFAEVALGEMGTFFNNMFGTSYASGWEFFDAMIDRINEFMDWTSLMTTDWSLTWKLMQTNTAIALVTIGDKAFMMFNTIKAGVIAAGAGMFQAMKNTAHNIGLAFEIIVKSIVGMFKGLWAGIKSKFKGGDFLSSFKEAYDKERAKIEGKLKPIGEGASEAFTDAFVKNMGADSPLKGTLDELRSQADELKNQMEAARDMKRKERLEDASINQFVGPQLPPEEAKKPPEQSAAEALKMELEAGRYGFAEIGNKIQDTLLKDKENDEQKKQTGLLEAGLTKQDDLIKAVKESGMKPGVLT